MGNTQCCNGDEGAHLTHDQIDQQPKPKGIDKSQLPAENIESFQSGRDVSRNLNNQIPGAISDQVNSTSL